MRCHRCRARMEEDFAVFRLIVKGRVVAKTRVRGYICPDCDEQVFDLKTVSRLENHVDRFLSARNLRRSDVEVQ